MPTLLQLLSAVFLYFGSLLLPVCYWRSPGLTARRRAAVVGQLLAAASVFVWFMLLSSVGPQDANHILVLAVGVNLLAGIYYLLLLVLPVTVKGG